MVFSTFRNYFKPGTPCAPQTGAVPATACSLHHSLLPLTTKFGNFTMSYLWSMAQSQSDFNHQGFPQYVQFLEVTITNNQLTLIKPKPHQTNRDFSYQKHSNIITFQKKGSQTKNLSKIPLNTHLTGQGIPLVGTPARRAGGHSKASVGAWGLGLCQSSLRISMNCITMINIHMSK